MESMFSCFEEGIIYDPKQKVFCTLAGDPVVRFGIPTTDEERLAQRHSLGLTCADSRCECHISDDYHDVGAVNACLVEGNVAPTHITCDMVPGS